MDVDSCDGVNSLSLRVRCGQIPDGLSPETYQMNVLIVNRPDRLFIEGTGNTPVGESMPS